MLPSVVSAVAAHKARRARIAARAVPDEPIDLKRKKVPKVPIVEKVETVAPKSAEPPLRIEDILDDNELTVVEERRRPKVRHIQEVVAAVFSEDWPSVTVIDILSPRKEARIVWPRQVSMWCCKKFLPKSLPEIGRAHGGRDHTTALHSIRKVESLIATNPELCAQIATILNILNSRNFIVPTLAELGIPQNEVSE